MRFRLDRLQAESSRNMYSEQGFDALIAAGVRAGVPAVDGRVVLHAGIGAAPRGLGDLAPEVLRAEWVSTTSPVVREMVSHWPPVIGGAHELVGDAHGVVRVLPADRVVGVAVEVATRSRPAMSACAFFSSRTFQLMKSTISGWSMSRQTILAARRVVPPLLVAPAARSNTSRKLIRPELGPAARELLLLAADGAEVGARARAVLEEPRLGLHEVVDAHQVVARPTG